MFNVTNLGATEIKKKSSTITKKTGKSAENFNIFHFMTNFWWPFDSFVVKLIWILNEIKKKSIK